MNLLPLFLLASTISSHQAHLNATLARTAALGDTRKVAIQLKNGADVNTLTILGQRPLELAVEYHHFETARFLLDHGALVNSASSFGTPLYWAVIDHDVAVTRLLLGRGAWVDYGTQFASPLTAILQSFDDLQGQPSNVMAIGADVLPHMPHNRRLARMIKAKLMDQFMQQFATVLPEEMKQRHASVLQIVRLLLASGANVNRKGSAGAIPLMNAIVVDNADGAKLLIDHGADVRAKDDQGMTALQYASLSGALELVKLLIDKGADVNAQGKNNYTSLFYAVQGKKLEIVQFLLDHGADPNLSPKSEETVLGMAKRYGDPKIITLLQNAGAK